MTGPVVIFLGPSLPAAGARRHLDATFLAPARQGDVWRAVRAHRPRAIGLIDGRFLDVPSVWHRELLWAMAEGVAVWGAASMGALRAAELRPFGMRGVGQVFEAYRDGRWPGYPEPFEDDDEVAVVHAPAELGGAPLSDAMVDLRATLLAAEAAGVVDRAARLGLAAAMKRRHFPRRSVRALLDEAAEPWRGRLAAWLPAGVVSQKARDAVLLLQAMAKLPAGAEAEFRFERALVWERFVARAEARERAATPNLRTPSPWSLRPEDIEAWLR